MSISSTSVLQATCDICTVSHVSPNNTLDIDSCDLIGDSYSEDTLRNRVNGDDGGGIHDFKDDEEVNEDERDDASLLWGTVTIKPE